MLNCYTPLRVCVDEADFLLSCAKKTTIREEGEGEEGRGKCMYKMEVGDMGCLLRVCDSCTSDCLEAAAALLSGVHAEARLFRVASK